jgi:threonyl-tRNA synthetase
MSNQELLTYLFNAIALGFLTLAAIDFGTRAVAVYNQVKIASDSPLTNSEKLVNQLPPAATPQKLTQLPDPWLLPLLVEESVVLVKVVQKEQKHLRLLPPAKETGRAVAPKLGDLLTGVDLDKLKLRQARKIAKVLGIAQKVNGRDQKLAFLVNQIKLKLQQPKLEVTELVRQELLAC